MKSLRKMIALLIATVMMVGTVMPAFATTVFIPAKEYDAEAKYYQADPTTETGYAIIGEGTLTEEAYNQLVAGGVKLFYEHDPSITIKSPVLGAQYEAYKIFELTMDEDYLNYSYTIDTNSPWYPWVAEYVENHTERGLILSEITTETVVDADNPENNYKKFNVSASTEENPVVLDANADPVTYYGNFDAQDFGHFLEEKIKANAQLPDGNENKVTLDPPATPNYKEDDDGEAYDRITVATSDQVTFEEDIDLGYYLIIATYPPAITGKATINYPDESGHDGVAFTLNDDELEDIFDPAVDDEGNPITIESMVDAFVEEAVDDDFIAAKIVGEKNSFGDQLTSADPEYAKFVQDLKDTLKEDTMRQIAEARAKYEAEKYDINVQTQRLVFVDSTDPDIEIYEKNTIDTWDIPVNPDGHATTEYLPEHGEPEGGKNIIVGYQVKDADGHLLDEKGNVIPEGDTETKPWFVESPEEAPGYQVVPVYADWTEANIGDKIHYEIRVNAMNFVRDDSYSSVDKDNTETPESGDVIPKDILENDETAQNNTKVHQVKEYVIADFQDNSLSFIPDTSTDLSKMDKIIVTIVDDDGKVVQIEDENGDLVDAKFDYTTWYKNFFIPENVDVTSTDPNTQLPIIEPQPTDTENILQYGGGIVIPWVKTVSEADVTEEELAEILKNHPNYTVNEEPVYDTINGEKVPKMTDKLDEYGERVYDIVYTYKKNDTVVFTGTEAEAAEYAKEHAEDMDGATKETVYVYVKLNADGTVPYDNNHDMVYSETQDDNHPNRTALKKRVEVQETTKWYVYSIYDSEVTIVVNYTMTLTDKADIDGLGNINYSQYGMNWVENNDYEYEAPVPTNPNPEWPEKPDEEREVDTATVYTYAVAIQKVDERGNELAGAEFEIAGLKATKVADGYYKVQKYYGDEVPADETGVPTTPLVSDKNGLLVIDGFRTSDTLTITETKAPDGYNKLTGNVTTSATKVGKPVTTSSETTYYGADGLPTTKINATTRVTIYKDGEGNFVAAKKECTDGETRYYDDEDLENEISEDKFTTDIATLTETGPSDADVTSQVEPYAFKVENKRGVELPSTGGQGTRMLYTVGGILVGLAGVLLVFRRRRA